MAEQNGMILSPNLYWDSGTAYDLFISLQVLHEPRLFGLRPAWAAGMRSRLPGDERETLAQFTRLGSASHPYHWIYRLPDPKDGAAALGALEQIAPEDRLLTLADDPGVPGAVRSMLRQVAQSGLWGEAELELLSDHFRKKGEKKHIKPGVVETILNWYAEPSRSGERLLLALRAYHDVFYAEEEQRIKGALQTALERAQELAEKITVPELVEQLSQGVMLEGGFETSELLLVPSYWGTPLLFFGRVSKEREILLFGARPKDASLVPGETVPDAQLQALKALSDPTRLRILRLLSEAPLTPTQLARQLRLRPSTVVHHLDVLRLATLVQLSVGSEGKEKRYAARSESVGELFANLEKFLQVDE